MGGGGKTTQVTEAKNEPWGPQQPFLIEGYNRARSYLDSDNPRFFPGSTVAGQSDLTQQGIGLLGGFGQSDAFQTAMGSTRRVATDGGLNGLGMETLTRTARGDFLSPESNPAFRGMLDQTINAIRPGVDAAFAGAGRTGSGAHSAAFADAATRAGTQLAYQNYGQERQAQQQAAGLLNQFGLQDAGMRMGAGQALAQLGLMPAQTALQAGGMQDARAQELLDADVARWNFDQNREYAKVANYMQLLGNVIPGTQTQTTTTRGGSGALQTLGGITSTLGALGSLGQGIGAVGRLFSDERVKEDIRPVGMLNNGLPVYAYRYKGQPQTQIGLLAQDVQQVNPEAVTPMTASGILGVDYARAVA